MYQWLLMSVRPPVIDDILQKCMPLSAKTGILLSRTSEIEYLFFVFPVRLTLTEKDEAQQHTRRGLALLETAEAFKAYLTSFL